MCDEVEIQSIECKYNFSADVEKLRQMMAEALMIPKEILHEENRTDEG